jgi:hypothetical protein
MHLVSVAQAAAISFGKNMEIYEEALEPLHAQRRGQSHQTAVGGAPEVSG